MVAGLCPVRSAGTGRPTDTALRRGGSQRHRVGKRDRPYPPYRRLHAIFADISDYLSNAPEQIVVVRAEDNPADLAKARGKQDWKRSGATAGSESPSPANAAEKGTERLSRSPRVFARLVRIRKIHALSEERPSNRLMPVSTPSQHSWTISSATARLGV